MLISEISELVIGQKTSNFKKNPLPECEVCTVPCSSYTSVRTHRYTHSHTQTQTQTHTHSTHTHTHTHPLPPTHRHTRTHTHTHTHTQSRSFSLLYSGRSLDIICKDKKEFETWTTGIQALMNGFADKDALESYMALVTNNKRRQTKTLQEDKVLVSFSSLGTISRTKVLVQESKFFLSL